MVSTSAVARPPIDQLHKREANTKAARIQGLVAPIPCHPIYRFVYAFVDDSCIGAADPSPSPCRRSWHPHLRGVASSSPPRPCATYLTMKTVRRFDDPPVPLSTFLSHPRP